MKIRNNQFTKHLAQQKQSLEHIYLCSNTNISIIFYHFTPNLTTMQMQLVGNSTLEGLSKAPGWYKICQQNSYEVKQEQAEASVQLFFLLQLFIRFCQIQLYSHWSIFLAMLEWASSVWLKVSIPGRHSLLSFEGSERSNWRSKSILYHLCFTMWSSG